MAITDISISGFIVGTIWMPAVEAYKPLRYSITREEGRFYGDKRNERYVGTLRDHVLHAVNDGDFQSCTIALGELVVTCHRGRRKVVRSFPLSHFPSIVDCLHPDGDDWCPQGDCEE